jgi:hypothetical protein
MDMQIAGSWLEGIGGARLARALDQPLHHHLMAARSK